VATVTDTLFRRATVVDGTGADRYEADVLVRGATIAAIGHDVVADGARVVDAEGLVLAPGFIDMHAHSDLAVLQPSHLAKVTQGVTTEVVGQDGIGYAPTDAPTLAQVRRQIAGWNGDPADLDFGWRGVGDYLDRVDAGVATNIACLVPQGNLRLMTVGPDDRPASPAEIARMKQLLGEALEHGAVGMSSGLTYTPGMYADTEELAALCEVVAEHGGFYAPHTRSYGAGALESYAEMLELARRTGCAVHLTHATMNFPVNRGRAGEFLRLVDAAIADGCDVTLDSYPYLPGSTTLSALLPSWASSSGVDATLARLEDPEARERIRVAVDEVGSDGSHGVVVDWEAVQLAGVSDPGLEPLVGTTVAALAAERGTTPIEVFFDLLLRDRLATSILQHVGDEQNLQEIMRHRVHMGGSDGILVGSRPHPRAWGTFARYLARYTRELGVLGLEACVNHLSGRPAARLGLRDRGLVREGYAADLVLFDAETVEDAATFDHPRLPATGIRSVLVNGVFAIDDGTPTGDTAGHSLRGDHHLRTSHNRNSHNERGAVA
jgi:N-acyl-D-amino-acid deacylase